MKNSKLKISLLLISLTLLVSIRPALALNQYSVHPGAQFRWDATKYYFQKDILEYTHNYYLEFNFTNWAGISGAEYLNGTINTNGTVYIGELSFASYWFGASSGGYWITQILDDVDIYLICNTEIEQSTILSAQSYAASSWLTFTEVSHYNFTLTGTYVEGDETDIYTGNIRFNSDKVLSYVFDEMVSINNTNDVTMYIERYIWTLTYTPGTPSSLSGDNIPGFSIFSLIAAITIGVILLIREKKLINSIKLK